MVHSVLGGVQPLQESNRRSVYAPPPPSSNNNHTTTNCPSRSSRTSLPLAKTNNAAQVILRRLLSDDPHGAVAVSPPSKLRAMDSVDDDDTPNRGASELVVDGDRDMDHVIHSIDDATADISLLSMESKDTTSLLLANTQSEETASDCGTEVSAVAMKRAWLNDFTKQQKKHYEKNSVGKKSNNDDEEPLQKPTRPKVARRMSTSVVPTPLPPPSAAALVKRIVDPKATPVPRTATKRFTKPKPEPDDVQATDEGYASVAKLSAWLADDPTSTKKVRPIRRGANVIAKSRKFDKQLANVIFAEDEARLNIRSGSVASMKKHWLDPHQSSSEDTTTDDETTSLSSSRQRQQQQEHWPVEPSSSFTAVKDTASTFSVSDKKHWLSNAFKKPDGTNALVPPPPTKAHTEILTSQDARNDLSSRAKQMWRKRTPTKRRTPQTPTKQPQKQQSVTLPRRPATEVKIRPSAMEHKVLRPSISSESSSSTSSHEEEDQVVDFYAARNKLVERSKVNGNSVKVLSKVDRRKAKFEQLEKESRRKSMPFGMLKASWDECDDETKPSTAYVKKYVEDIAPKKSLEELP